jgi:hypothetical protein
MPINAAPDVGVVFIDPKDKAYLSITARARVMRDKAARLIKKQRARVLIAQFFCTFLMIEFMFKRSNLGPNFLDDI